MKMQRVKSHMPNRHSSNSSENVIELDVVVVEVEVEVATNIVIDMRAIENDERRKASVEEKKKRCRHHRIKKVETAIATRISVTTSESARVIEIGRKNANARWRDNSSSIVRKR